MTTFEDLKWRGLINDVTSPDVEEAINKGGLKFYIGVDPTGDSLHIGHYCTVIATAKRLMDVGHTPILIAGGGTGLIGDPKPNVERPMISKEAVKHNIECIQKQLNKILGGNIQIVNNFGEKNFNCVKFHKCSSLGLVPFKILLKLYLIAYSFGSRKYLPFISITLKYFVFLPSLLASSVLAKM